MKGFSIERPRGGGRFRAAVWMTLAVVWASPVAAQQFSSPGERIYEEQLRVRLDQQEPGAREIGVDLGGWFNFAVFHYDDASDRTVRTLNKYELRGWVSVNIQGVHRLYFRGLLNYDQWVEGGNPINDRGDDHEEQVERAWYQFDLGRLIRNRTGQVSPVDFRFKVGREYATIGTALTMSMPLDLIQFNAGYGDWDFMTFLGKAIGYWRNIDDSDRVWDHQDRWFWGTEVGYRGIDGHRLFAYLLWNDDSTESSPHDTVQNYEYSTRYIGVGAEGWLLVPDLNYQVEVVGEWGQTYSDTQVSQKDPVCATAVDVLLSYLFPVQTKPKVMFEYLFGSGDGDRLYSATSTVGGNKPHTTDTAFNAFGFRDTGIAFAPRISNIHIWVLGAGFFPLEKIRGFEKMEIGTKVFFYRKDAPEGAISDTTAVNNSAWLGWEWDIYCNWRITSDLAWTIRYGNFQPATAFHGSDASCRNFLYAGVTFSF